MLLCLLTFLGLFQVNANDRLKTVRINLHKDNSAVKEILAELENQTGYKFFYSNELFDENARITLHLKNTTLDKALSEIFKNDRLTFTLRGDQIVIKRLSEVGNYKESKGPVGLTEFGQLYSKTGSFLQLEKLEFLVKGKVTNDNGEGIPGVNVVIKGTTIGTLTDAEGFYSINAPDGSATLVFTYVGYASEEIPINNQSNVDVSLLPDIQTLQEIIVVGYGTQQRKDLTGAISSVSGEQIRTVPVTGADQAIQGRAAGVQVIQNSGAPGGSVSIRIRGVSTVGNNEPLYVIDGIPVFNNHEPSNSNTINPNAGSSSNTLNTINPNDIESIEILKDASATAIYGARGANGVVIITTKRGKEGRTNVNFDTYYGVQQAGKMVEMLNSSEFAELHNSIMENGAQPKNPAFANPASLGKGTDWLGELFRPAAIQNYNLSLSGGSEKTQFAVSGGYFKQDGIIIGTDFDRYSVRVNLDHRVSKKIKFGNSLSLSRTTQNIITTDEDTQSGLVFLAMAQQPGLPVYRNGTFAGPEGPVNFVGDKTNPIGLASVRENKIFKNRLLGNIYGEYEIIRGLTFKSSWGLDALLANRSLWEPDYKWGGIVHPLSELSKRNSQEFIWLAENTLTFSKTIAEKHALTVLAGITAQSSRAEYQGASIRGFRSNFTPVLSAGNPENASVGGGIQEWSLLSYIGRVNYSFNNKYLLTGTIRVDGSSRFGSENKFGVFPSVSVGWRISEEDFMRDISSVSDLKLRASYGVTGNQEIGNYSYYTLLSPDQRYTFGNPGGFYTGIGPYTFPNPDIQWESVYMSDLGIDLGLFNNRVILNLDLYQKTTEGMLQTIPIPASAGYRGNPTVNVGKIRNRGIEISALTQNLVGEFTWNTNFNFAANTNKVISLNDSLPINGAAIGFNQTLTRTQEGHPIGAFYGYVTEGLFQTQGDVEAHAKQNPGTNPASSTAPGDIRFKDVKKDGVIDDKDRVFLGNPMPKFIFGLTNSVTYKNFDLSIFLQGVVGNKVLNANRFFNEQMSGAFNQTKETLNRWNGPGTSNSMPRAVWNDPNGNSRPSDRYIEDGSYMRIKNLTLGYSLPSELVKGIQKIRIYASAQNLLTLTKYKGFDPEIGAFNQSSLQTGVDNGTYPVARTFIIGLNLGF